MNYQDIVMVENFEEADQFKYEHNDQPGEVCTPVGYECIHEGDCVLICFEGIYFDGDA